MIQIYPTTASGLSHNTYQLIIRERGEPANLKRERSQSVSISLSGESVVSAWKKYVSGTEFTAEASLSDSDYATLRSIDEHATVFEWIISTQGRTFKAIIDVQKAVMNAKNWQVSIKFTIVSELHR